MPRRCRYGGSNVMKLLATLMLVSAFAATDTSWLQWSGPRRNFMIDSPPLAASWPASGPKKRWERVLGEGHSAVIVEGNRIYTMYRALGQPRTQSETIAAFDAATGKTAW